MLKEFYRNVVPRFIRSARSYYIENRKTLKTYRRLIPEFNRYFVENAEEYRKYAGEIATINQMGDISLFPYDFVQNYSPEKVQVYKDRKKGLPYVMHKAKRLYFPRALSDKRVRRIYYELLIEQDAASPHLYMTEAFNDAKVDTIADIGSAEGVWALDLVERARAVYLFECEAGWQEALQATFEPWQDKVTLVNKFVSDKTGGEEVTLDHFFSRIREPLGSATPILIKIDVEGAEALVLGGAAETLKRENVRLICCTYHKQQDAADFEALLNGYGYQTGFSAGYMFLHNDRAIAPPYFRKGVIRAWR
jgi:hypothetical protein